MRMIDADALLRDIEKYHVSDGKFQHWVQIQPTIEPERTGKWIKEKSRGQLYQCSACNNYLDFRGLNAGRGSTNYCPNCGADMREEQDAEKPV